MSSDSENLLDIPVPQFAYASFWTRVGASFIDGIIISAIVLPLTYFNITNWKSSLLFTVVSIISMCYKPFFEYQYGATIGKKVVKIKVVNYEFGKAGLTEILLRNIINILIAVLSLVMTLAVFSMPGFEGVRGYMDYVTFVGKDTSSTWVSWLSWVYYVVDVIFLFTDEKKRTLHDRIGKTYVINLAE